MWVMRAVKVRWYLLRFNLYCSGMPLAFFVVVWLCSHRQSNNVRKVSRHIQKLESTHLPKLPEFTSHHLLLHNHHVFSQMLCVLSQNSENAVWLAKKKPYFHTGTENCMQIHTCKMWSTYLINRCTIIPNGVQN
jgi:hypothetical protein